MTVDLVYYDNALNHSKGVSICALFTTVTNTCNHYDIKQETNKFTASCKAFHSNS